MVKYICIYMSPSSWLQLLAPQDASKYAACSQLHQLCHTSAPQHQLGGSQGQQCERKHTTFLWHQDQQSPNKANLKLSKDPNNLGLKLKAKARG